MNKWLLAIIFCLGMTMLVLFYKMKSAELPPTPISTSDEIKIETYDVKRVRVISGHEFSLTLKDDRIVRAFLGVNSTPESKTEVIRLLNKYRGCQVVITHTPDLVSADLLLTQSGEVVSLTDWLLANDLAWDNQCQPPPVTWE